MEFVAELFLLAGSALILIASVGITRFGNVFSRMHAAAKAPTLAILLIAVGTALAVRTLEATILCLLVVTLQLIAGPVGAHMLARAVYFSDPPDLDGPDELADADAVADQLADADAVAGDGDDTPETSS